MYRYKGVTLIEVTVVMTIFAILSVMAINPVVHYFRNSIVDGDLTRLVTMARSARQSAISNLTGDDYSIRFLTDRYVIFPGTNYNPSGSQNQNIFLDTGVIVSTTFTNNQITFNNFTGRASQSGIIVISAFDVSREVYINPLGIVESII